MGYMVVDGSRAINKMSAQKRLKLFEDPSVIIVGHGHGLKVTTDRVEKAISFYHSFLSS